MKVVDITGVIQEGMWSYAQPYPKFKMNPVGVVPWAGKTVYSEVFDGMCSQTGTYLETPAHFFGNENSYLVTDIPLEKLVNISCRVLKINMDTEKARTQKIKITSDDLRQCANSKYLNPGDAILIATGWSKYWMDSCFVDMSPYLSHDAMMWLIEKKPFLLGSDTPCWENGDDPQGFFPAFYESNILMLAPCSNLESVRKTHCKLTVLPLKIPGTSCVPCRAIIIE